MHLVQFFTLITNIMFPGLRNEPSLRYRRSNIRNLWVILIAFSTRPRRRKRISSTALDSAQKVDPGGDFKPAYALLITFLFKIKVCKKMQLFGKSPFCFDTNLRANDT